VIYTLYCIAIIEIISLCDWHLSMDIRTLKLVKHLAGTLHFGRTSQACNISPSGLTRALQRLENELGKQLFVRNQRTVSLTESGKKFLSYAEDAIKLWDKLQVDLNEKGNLTGEITLYCSVTAILSILPDILERFRTLYPDIQINLQTGDAAMALSRLENREVDVSIAALPDKLPQHMEFLQIIETPLIFISSQAIMDTFAPDSKDLSWEKIPLILAERGLSRKRAENWLRKKDILPNIYASVAGNEAILSLVAMGCGVGVIPELVLKKSPLRSKIMTLHVSPPLEPFSVGACTTIRNKQKPIVSAFWQNVKQGTSGERI
jgi:LysR family positive regulator for ilvC